MPVFSEDWVSSADAVATATVDLTPYWRRHLRALRRLFTAAANHDELGRRYRTAVNLGLTAFLHGLQDCTDIFALHRRAHDTDWWDAICRAELDSPTLLGLRIQGVPLSGHGLASAALALRYLETTRHLRVDPTTVLDYPPASMDAWLQEV